MTDYSVLWREDVEPEDARAFYQEIIDNGQAWRLEGHVGRTAMGLIEDGQCMLGEVAHKDYYGNVIPSRYEVETGTPGSPEFANWGDA